jgi:hypothetical protein
MRWYSFWDDSGQFHHLPSVTTILDATMAPARSIAAYPGPRQPTPGQHPSTPGRQPTGRFADERAFRACCQQGKPSPSPPPSPNPAANSNPTSANGYPSPPPLHQPTCLQPRPGLRRHPGSGSWPPPRPRPGALRTEQHRVTKFGPR